MKLWEAIRELQNGKKITRLGWGDDYIHIVDKKLVNNYSSVYGVTLNTLLTLSDNGWEIYEEIVPFSEVPVGEWCQFRDKSGYIVKTAPFIRCGKERCGISSDGHYFAHDNNYLVRYPIDEIPHMK